MYRAMVIDDEKWTLMGICRTFPWEKYGFEPPAATTDPEEGLEQILAMPPDAVFVDIRMPEMSGLELMAAARKENIASEFIILSGLQDFEYARIALQYAAFDYILKPLHMDTADALLAKLKAHLDKLDRSPRLSAPQEEVHQRLLDSAAKRDNEMDGDSFAQLVAYVEAHLEDPLLLKDVAAHFYLTPNYVSSLFRTRLDTTYSAYLNHLRIEKAMTLLRGTQKAVEEIAQYCGYSDGRYFSRVFRQQMGLTPMQYRKGK